jgi:hypothetical protein
LVRGQVRKRDLLEVIGLDWLEVIGVKKRADWLEVGLGG